VNIAKPKQTLQSLDALLNAAVDAMIISDQKGRMLRVNPAAQAYFGWSEEDLIGKNVHVLMPNPDHDRHDTYLKSYRDGGNPAIIGIGREVTALHADGNTFPIHLSVGEIEGNGKARFIAIIRDLSEEKATKDVVKQLETHMAHADRLVVLGELTAGIAHEINQPLTAIAAFADAGARLVDTNTPESLAELENICKRVAEQARRAGAVVNRLRRLSRKGELTRSTHDVRLLLKNVLLLFDHELKQTGITLNTRFADRLPSIVVDEIQIQQVLVNLVKNAIDAVRSNSSKNPEVIIDVTSNDQTVEIRVSDNGAGVPADFKKNLFEPFYTTKEHGVGLGLSICKNIATLHGGKLTHKNRNSGGARFTLSLPLSYIG
jgi:two-component system sensor kinase FixL